VQKLPINNFCRGFARTPLGSFQHFPRHFSWWRGG